MTWHDTGSGPGADDQQPEVYARVVDGQRETYTITWVPGYVRVQYAVNGVDTDRPVTLIMPGSEGILQDLVDGWKLAGYARADEA